jgi:putative membrane protein
VTTPTLPRRTPGRVPLRRHLVEYLITSVSFWLIAWILPGISIADFGTALVAAALLSVLNAVLWPLISRYFARIILWTAGLLGLVANGLLLWLTADVLDGLTIDTVWEAVLAAFLMTAVGIVLSTWLSIDDDAVWQRQTVRRMVNRLEPPTPTDVPGILFIQIDGLAEPVLRQALADGHAPTLARWIESGSHQLTGWECDLSSQTGASQAGILHGNNHNMPAFRWYDKEAGKVFTSNRPRDAAEIEARQSDGHGLLVHGGVSRSNVFSGDSVDSAITFSTLLDKSRHSHHTANYFLSDPYAVSRLIALTLADAWREVVDRRRTRRAGIEPRLKRGGIYPLLRAATTTTLRDLTIYTLMSDVYRGVPSAYADFVGYDEVAHHSGLFAPTALDTLRRLDTQFARLEYAIAEAPRPYHVVVLSDHGQTQGATFLQRYGRTLQDYVDSLIAGDVSIVHPELASEGWGNLNGALTEAVRDKDSRIGKLLAVATRNRVVDGDVVLGPAYHDEKAQADGTDTTSAADVVVLASGNLGLISFTDIEGRATVEELGTRFPGLIAGLAEHPGIGFVMVRSEQFGAMVFGGRGIRYLSDDRVEGEDPLVGFGPNAADHLRRTDSFTNAPDILVNSFFDPVADEGAAFEELIGFHGGMGGNQTHPFIMYPTGFSLPGSPIVGAATVHHLFKRWMTEIDAGTAPAPWIAPEPTPTSPTGTT